MASLIFMFVDVFSYLCFISVVELCLHNYGKWIPIIVTLTDYVYLTVENIPEL